MKNFVFISLPQKIFWRLVQIKENVYLTFFLNILVVGTGWSGDEQSILIDGCIKSSFQVGGHVQPPFFLPLRYLETDTLGV